jgi:hypothetical protein
MGARSGGRIGIGMRRGSLFREILYWERELRSRERDTMSIFI